MPYLIMLIMTGPDVLEDPENKSINSWPERNSMALDRMMINVWTIWVIDLGYGKGQSNEDVGSRPTKYKAYQVNRISLNEYDKTK